ncbi:hypothetical protein GCM10010501_11030 [Streptomyces libani subsp. rufus]|nr:hypothetical protein GCM10010501_11030 [Streptomyces libani subsp. rufus]
MRQYVIKIVRHAGMLPAGCDNRARPPPAGPCPIGAQSGIRTAGTAPGPLPSSGNE